MMWEYARTRSGELGAAFCPQDLPTSHEGTLRRHTELGVQSYGRGRARAIQPYREWQGEHQRWLRFVRLLPVHIRKQSGG